MDVKATAIWELLNKDARTFKFIELQVDRKREVLYSLNKGKKQRKQMQFHVVNSAK